MHKLNAVMLSVLLIIPLMVAVPMAHAVVVSIDPGPVGSSFSSMSFPFTDLNGTAFSGQTIDLDFVFSDMKHLEIDLLSSSQTDRFNVAVFLTSTGFQTNSGPSTNDVFLSDENGASIFSGFSNAFSTDPGEFQYSGVANNSAPGLDGLIFHDVHFNLTLPPTSSGSVASGSLLFLSDNASLTVGEWAVPAPSTMLLMSTGLLGLVGWRWRRTKNV